VRRCGRVLLQAGVWRQFHGQGRQPESGGVGQGLIGRAIDGPAVDHELPVHAAGPHLVLEGFHVLARHVGVVAAVENQDLAADVPGVGGGRRVEAARVRVWKSPSAPSSC